MYIECSMLNFDQSEREEAEAPLKFLFEENADDSDSKALIYKLHTREHIT